MRVARWERPPLATLRPSIRRESSNFRLNSLYARYATFKELGHGPPDRCPAAKADSTRIQGACQGPEALFSGFLTRTGVPSRSRAEKSLVLLSRLSFLWNLVEEWRWPQPTVPGFFASCLAAELRKSPFIWRIRRLFRSARDYHVYGISKVPRAHKIFGAARLVGLWSVHAGLLGRRAEDIEHHCVLDRRRAMGKHAWKQYRFSGSQIHFAIICIAFVP